jgi:hypothetical protein
LTTATSAARVVITIGMMCPSDMARINTRGHGYPRASPRRRVAHYLHEDVQQQERYAIEEQARHYVRDR